MCRSMHRAAIHPPLRATHPFAHPAARHAALVIASLGALRGWRTMFGHLLSKERLPFTAGALCVRGWMELCVRVCASVCEVRGRVQAGRRAFWPGRSSCLDGLYKRRQGQRRRSSGYLRRIARCGPAPTHTCHHRLPPLTPPPAAYFGSLLATLYVSLAMRSYLFSLVFCAAQLVTLLYYVASYFPGGASGAQASAVMCCASDRTCLRCPARLQQSTEPSDPSPLFHARCVQSVLGFAGRGAMSLGGAALRASFSGNGAK